MSTPKSATPDQEETEKYYKYKGPGIISGLPINPSDQETFYHPLSLIKFYGFSEKDIDSWLNAGLVIEVSKAQVDSDLEKEQMKKRSRLTKINEVKGETNQVEIVTNPTNSEKLGEST